MTEEDINELRSKVEKALERGGGTHSFDDVVRGLMTGDMQAFSKNKTIVVTQIVNAPRKRWLNIFVAAGEYKDVMSMQEEILDFAAGYGCEFMAMNGRKGWAKILPRYGWSDVSVSYAIPVRRELNG